MHELARTGQLNHQQLMDELEDLALLYTGPNGLADYMGKLGEDLVQEIQGVKASANLSDVVKRAFGGAQLFFKAWNHMKIP